MSELPSSVVFGDSKRLFINTELGCASACSYCYLPLLGLPIGKQSVTSTRVSAKLILKEISRDPRVIWGPEGTVFSIGCFSECWDNRNRSETIELVLGLMHSGNWIQLATKREIRSQEIRPIPASKYWTNQVCIFISSATITKWKEYERGTTAPTRRFRSFSACHALGIPSFLYVKPVIPKVTLADAEKYARVMAANNVKAVVGDFFYDGRDGRKSPISDSLVVTENDEVQKLRGLLSKKASVFWNSTDALSAMRP